MIGVFDSGFGGLTVMKEILNLLPQYDYIYLGDQARYPYGPRSLETIRNFSDQNIRFLFQKKVKIILIACNSATTAALKFLQEKYPEKHILGVVVPATEQAIRESRWGRIGVAATKATIGSGVYEKELFKVAEKEYRPQAHKALTQIKISVKACPLLVPLIEESWHQKPETRLILKKYLRSLKSDQIDTLILGCTHYPIIEKIFARIMGRNCKIINASRAQAKALQTYLKQHPNLEQKLGKAQQRTFFTTDCPDKFAELGPLFLGQEIKNCQKVEIF